MIKRKEAIAKVQRSLAENPVTAILGPRQCGKTTLAHQVIDKGEGVFFDLENPTHLARLTNPLLALQNQTGAIVLDEIQRMPALFEILRVLVDTPSFKGKFLVLGSAAPSLVKGASESLAGRIGFVDLSGFNLQETQADDFVPLWVRGGFPLSYLSKSDAAAYRWRENFIRTFLERDIPQLGISIPATTLRRFWTMIAHYHGQVLNTAELARAIGSAEGTARKYLDILSGSYMVRQLQPYFANLKKRQVKAPKVYVRDSGILHALLALESADHLLSHPKLGASFEGFAVEEICASADSRNIYFWATHGGAELDLLLFSKGKAIGFEIKYTETPKITKSMRIALEDLNLHHLYLVYPGNETFPLSETITVIPVTKVRTAVQAD
ncbi:MAG: ATP-binding protein [Planctomycetes bacterium]|nr:ATP-binding protein [Planctomycetota bacterium]